MQLLRCVPAPIIMTFIPVFGFSPSVCCVDILGSLDSSIFARSGMRQFVYGLPCPTVPQENLQIMYLYEEQEERKAKIYAQKPGKRSAPAAWGLANPGLEYPRLSHAVAYCRRHVSDHPKSRVMRTCR
jgi:hypothetical protein